MPYFPLASNTNLGDWSRERLQNLIAHPDPTSGQYVLLGRKGMSFAGGAGQTAEVVAYCTQPGLPYVAPEERVLYVTKSGSTYKFYNSVNSTSPNTLTSASGEIWMAADFNYVVICCDTKYWVWDGSSLTDYTSAATSGAIVNIRGVCYQDGYFILWGSDGNRGDIIQWSNVDDPTTFSALDFAAAETSGDWIEAIVPGIGGLRVFGRSTVEDWYNAGADGWLRNSPSGIGIGCRGGKTVARYMDRFFWMGRDGRFYESQGGLGRPISPEWVEYYTAADRGYTIPYCFIYRDRGHVFYCIQRVKGAQTPTTIAYDVDTGLWCEFSTGSGPWIATGAIDAQNNQYIPSTAGLMIQDETLYTDNGTTIVASVATPRINNTGKAFDVGDVRLFIDSEDGATVDMQIARDWGGYGSAITATYNHTRREVVWKAMGQADNIVQMYFEIDQPVKRDIYGGAYGTA